MKFELENPDSKYDKNLLQCKLELLQKQSEDGSLTRVKYLADMAVKIEIAKKSLVLAEKSDNFEICQRLANHIRIMEEEVRLTLEEDIGPVSDTDAEKWREIMKWVREADELLKDVPKPVENLETGITGNLNTKK